MDEALRRIQAMGMDGKLDLRYLDLVTLPPLPDNVRQLDCSVNRLTSLDDLPQELRTLNCSENQLTSLPPLPPDLHQLACSKNQLTSLPPLPPDLYALSCNHNRLTSLPELPLALRTLHCMHNQIISLPPDLPPRLQSLRCSYGNKIKTIPSLPIFILDIQMDSNPLIYPYKFFYNQYIRTGSISQFKKLVNLYNDGRLRQQERTAILKPNIVARHFDADRIKQNLIASGIDPEEGVISDENWEKHFTRRGEVWTHGVGTKKGGKRKRKGKSRSSRKTRKV